jgi:hypothetical protein
MMASGQQAELSQAWGESRAARRASSTARRATDAASVTKREGVRGWALIEPGGPLRDADLPWTVR